MGTQIASQYDWWVFAFAAALAVIASLNAVRLFNFAQQRQGRAKAVAVLIAALACGCGIWAADCGAILAYRPAIGYDPLLIYLALFSAVVLAGNRSYDRVVFSGSYPCGRGGAGRWRCAYSPDRASGDSCSGFCGRRLGDFDLSRGWSGHAAWRRGSLSDVRAPGLARESRRGHAFRAGDHCSTNRSGGRRRNRLARLAHDSRRTRYQNSLWRSVSLGPWRLRACWGNFAGDGDQRAGKLSDALDKLSIGLLIFDADERILICNKPYRTMYNVPADVVVPPLGTLTRLLQYRTKNGTFREDPEQYLTNLRKSLRDGSLTQREPKLVDGRILSVSTHPMDGGGWVAIHENISERKHAEQEYALSQARDRRRVWIEEAIAAFRARAETRLGLVMASSTAMSGSAQSLLQTSARTSENAESALNSSQQAWTCTNSAALAAEHLSASIAEINRQLNQTVKAVNNVATRAAKSDVEIAALADSRQEHQ